MFDYSHKFYGLNGPFVNLGPDFEKMLSCQNAVCNMQPADNWPCDICLAANVTSKSQMWDICIGSGPGREMRQISYF